MSAMSQERMVLPSGDSSNLLQGLEVLYTWQFSGNGDIMSHEFEKKDGQFSVYLKRVALEVEMSGIREVNFIFNEY
jgi:hypothetical protein